MSNPDPAPVYCIVVRPLASAVPPACRLKRALKYMLRACDLRAVSVEQLPVPPSAEPGSGAKE